MQRQITLLAPLRQSYGDLSRFWMPSVVTMPELQGPVMPCAQIPQQTQQCHGVLSAGDRQQQGAALRQQLRVLQQLAVQPLVPVQPWLASCHRDG